MLYHMIMVYIILVERAFDAVKSVDQIMYNLFYVIVLIQKKNLFYVIVKRFIRVCENH
jgi:hypothetical protein